MPGRVVSVMRTCVPVAARVGTDFVRTRLPILVVAVRAKVIKVDPALPVACLASVF